MIWNYRITEFRLCVKGNSQVRSFTRAVMDLSTDEALRRAKLNLSDRDQKGITRKELKKTSDEESFEWEYYLSLIHI